MHLTRRLGLLFLTLGFCLLLVCPSTHALERFRDNRNGTVTDTLNGLTWIQDPTRMKEFREGMIWVQAKDACNSLEYAGYGAGTWRLPSVKELETLVSESRSAPRVDSQYFVAVSTRYWSSTTYTGAGAKAWTVNFKDGSLGSDPKLSLLNPVRLLTRCVRD